ncbi:MAG: hypothetical protein HY821_08650 [Acidobacteria bacterium]|nr:hypothetical protein [Acidobacteriota bacterium]
MDQIESAVTLNSYGDLAARLVFSLLRPTLTDDEVHDGCRDALALGALCAVVRPSDLDAAVRQCEGTSLVTASAVGGAHGLSTTAVKIYETRDLLRRGAREIVLTVNIGKLVSRQFQYIESEVLQIARACHEEGARITVNLESPYLQNDLRIIALKICKRCEVDFVQNCSELAPSADLAADLALFTPVLKDLCRIQAGGAIGELDAALDACARGAARIVTPHAARLLDQWQARLQAAAQTS